jgi:type IV secretion system protein VirD4
MKKLPWGEIAEYILCSVISYVMMSFIFDIGNLIGGKNKFYIGTIFQVCIHNSYAGLCIILALLLGGLIMLLIGTNYSLDHVKNRRAGNGQYGKARFMTNAEKRETYLWVPIGKEEIPGFVVSYNKHGWLVDTSDQSILMVSPPGGGKTTCEMIPTLKYNAAVNKNTGGRGASSIVTDAKGTLESTCSGFLEEAGYSTFALNFRFPLYSHQYNLMNNVNIFIDKAKAAADSDSRIIAQAQAEKYAKVLAQSIVNNTAMPVSSSSEGSQYFNETSEGLITAIVLIVSEYGYEGERHIISVFRLIIDLNGLAEESTETAQKNRLEQLFSLLPPENRAKLFAGPSIKADVRTSMNIFSSALGKLVSFIDSELEQMICEHSVEFNTEEFIRKPTIIFLIVPDEDTTKHFFSSLFIRNIMNELIALAEKELDQVLTRKLLCIWDEFGQIPPIKDFSSLITAARSRGIRFLAALQSLDQLDEKYSPAQAKTIRKAFQMTLFSYQSPNAIDTAREFSEVLGTYTTTSGSVSRGDRNDSSSINLIECKLMKAEDIINMPFGDWIVLKSGCHPLKTHLKPYFKVFKDIKAKVHEQRPAQVKTIHYLTEEKIRRHVSAKHTIAPGQFDRD